MRKIKKEDDEMNRRKHISLVKKKAENIQNNKTSFSFHLGLSIFMIKCIMNTKLLNSCLFLGTILLLFMQKKLLIFITLEWWWMKRWMLLSSHIVGCKKGKCVYNDKLIFWFIWLNHQYCLRLIIIIFLFFSISFQNNENDDVNRVC